MEQPDADDGGMTILVTGGSGFLGSRCVIEALRKGQHGAHDSP